MLTMTNASHDQTLVPPEGGELIEVAGNRIRIIVATPGQLVCDYTAAPRFAGPPLHVHPGFDETYLVLEGALGVTVRGEEHELGPGAASYVRGTTPHTFRNPGDDPLRFLSICSPGGFEHFFRAIAAGDQALLAETCERFGYETLGAAA